MSEITIKVEIAGLEALTAALIGLVKEKSFGSGAVEQPLVQNNAAPVPQAPVQQPIPMQPPMQAPIQTMPPTQTMAQQPAQVPTTHVPITHTMDELAIAASQLVNMGKQQRLMEILSGFRVNSLVELPQEQYSAFAGCLKVEGAQF